MTRAVVLLVVLGLLGCGGEDPPPSSGRGRGPAAAAPTAEVSSGPPIAPTRTGRTRSTRPTAADEEAAAGRPRFGAGLGTPPPPPPDEAPEPEGPPPRDLGAELRDAIGSIEGCLDMETARRLEGTLRVPITATLLPSGRVSSASANGGSLSRAQNACIEGVVEHASIRGPIEDAPRSVSTTIEMNVEVTEPEEPERPTTTIWGTPVPPEEPSTGVTAGGTTRR